MFISYRAILMAVCAAGVVLVGCVGPHTTGFLPT
jgi:hypothetical protein